MRVTNMARYCGNGRYTRQAESLGLLIYVDVVQHDAHVSKHRTFYLADVVRD
jgi:hypothetical protein